jgi:hypothetical protein
MDAILCAVTVLIAYTVGVVIFHFRREIMNFILGLVSWWIGMQWWPKVKKFFARVWDKIVLFAWLDLNFHFILCGVCWEWRLYKAYRCIDTALTRVVYKVLYFLRNVIHSIDHAATKFEGWLWDLLDHLEQIDEGLK